VRQAAGGSRSRVADRPRHDPPQQFNALGINFDFGLAQQLVGEQASAYADLVDAPDRELDALGIECRLLGENMLIDVSTTACRSNRKSVTQPIRAGAFRASCHRSRRGDPLADCRS
jgi:hypothetical protein